MPGTSPGMTSSWRDRTSDALVSEEHPLDLLAVGRLGQRQHQQNTRLLRIKRIRDDEVVFVVLGFPIARDDAVPDTAAANDRDPLLVGVIESWLDRGPGKAAITDASMHDPL